MSDRDFSDVADPELIARLAAWFGEGPLPAPDPDELERSVRADALAAIEAVVDVELRARIEGQKQRSETLLSWTRDTIEPTISTDIVQLRIPKESDWSSSRWGPDYFEEVEQPDDIREALSEKNTPQSILRDLFRPVHYFGDVVLERSEPLHDVGAGPTSVTARLMATPIRVKAQRSALSLIDEDLGGLRSRLAEPWADSAIEAPTVPTGSDMAEHMRWFSGSGGRR